MYKWYWSIIFPWAKWHWTVIKFILSRWVSGRIKFSYLYSFVIGSPPEALAIDLTVDENVLSKYQYKISITHQIFYVNSNLFLGILWFIRTVHITGLPQCLKYKRFIKRRRLFVAFASGSVENNINKNFHQHCWEEEHGFSSLWVAGELYYLNRSFELICCLKLT